jgi:hypothetical protein
MRIGAKYYHFQSTTKKLLISLSLYSSAESRNSAGGTSKASVLAQISSVRERYTKSINELL